MDNYTRMCEKADLPWEKIAGDVVFHNGEVKIYLTEHALYFNNTLTGYSEPLAHSCLHLPSVEQLVGMDPDKCEIELCRDRIKENTVKPWHVLICDNEYQVPLCQGDTPEEALLLAIMHEKFQKTWDGAEWV